MDTLYQLSSLSSLLLPLSLLFFPLYLSFPSLPFSPLSTLPHPCVNVCMPARVRVWVCSVSWPVCWVQKIAYRSWISPSPRWVLELTLGLRQATPLYWPSHSRCPGLSGLKTLSFGVTGCVATRDIFQRTRSCVTHRNVTGRLVK